MKRIMFCVAVGKPKFGEMAMGLARSLNLIQDQTERVIMTDLDGFDWSRYFSKVIRPTGPRSALDKLTALEHTDADQVISLDVDMLAFKRLDDIWDYCAGTGKPFLTQGRWGKTGMFHGQKVEDLCAANDLEMAPLFNGGLAYYERSPVYDELLGHMREAEANYDTYGYERFRGNASEEVCIMHAMLKMRYFEMIPFHMNFNNSLSGLVGKLHLDVLKNECYAVTRQHQMMFVSPYIFHAWRYKDFLVYWKQLEKLKKLEQFEDKHPSLYLSRWQRRRRSVEQRWMKWFKRYY